MIITLEYAATLQVKGPASGSPLELPDGATVAEALRRLGIAEHHHRLIAPFVANRKVSLSTPLKEGDHLFLGLPIGGG
jgi:sulfur carrier protein ThiS